MNDRVLVTGGTGKTGRRLAKLLEQQGVPVSVGTRTPRGPGQVWFDWTDVSSHVAALDQVRAVFMVAPGNVPELLGAMRPFIDRALSSGDVRLVLLSSSMLEEGGPAMGAVHAYLHRHAPDWCVLRPSWFMQNFSEHQHIETIRREGRIYSATQDGRVPFIDAGDIAAVAAQALTEQGFGSGDLILTGPASLTYDQVAATISQVSGRSVAHVRLSVDELAARFEAVGIEQGFAEMLAGMDAAIAAGAEDRISPVVERVTSAPPTSFQHFAEFNAEVWR